MRLPVAEVLSSGTRSGDLTRKLVGYANRPNDRLLGGATTPVMPTKVGIHDFDAASKSWMAGLRPP
jgi:hypothetical protein